MKLRIPPVPAAVLAACLAAFPVRAAVFGAVVPETPVVEQPERRELEVVLGLVDPFAAQGRAAERPQAFTVLCGNGVAEEAGTRSEQLSALTETEHLGAPAWSARILLPDSGLCRFIMESKPVWMPERDRLVQYFSRVQVPVRSDGNGWAAPTGDRFEIVPLIRPFGLCAGMGFRARVLLDGKPASGVRVQAAHLNAPPRPGLVRVPPSAHHAFQELETDVQGLFHFVCPQPGWWVFAALAEGDPLQDPDGTLKPLELRAEFWVWMDPCKEKTTRRK